MLTYNYGTSKFMDTKKYKMRVVRGAFVDPALLDKFSAKTIEKLERDVWVSIDEVIVTLDEIKQLQKAMIKHYDDPNVPWYMDGYEEDDKDELIVAFGADDREGGKIFQFRRSDEKAIKEVVNYGISKGIPKEQMDFYKINF